MQGDVDSSLYPVLSGISAALPAASDHSPTTASSGPSSSSSRSPRVSIEAIPALLPGSTVDYLRELYASGWGQREGVVPRWTRGLEVWYQAFCPEVWVILEEDDCAARTALSDALYDLEAVSVSPDEEVYRKKVYELNLLHDVRSRFMRHHNISVGQVPPAWSFDACERLTTEACPLAAYDITELSSPVLYTVTSSTIDQYCLPGANCAAEPPPYADHTASTLILSSPFSVFPPYDSTLACPGPLFGHGLVMSELYRMLVASPRPTPLHFVPFLSLIVDLLSILVVNRILVIFVDLLFFRHVDTSRRIRFASPGDKPRPPVLLLERPLSGPSPYSDSRVHSVTSAGGA
ncbi:hypothetical protein JCM10207_007831 [Rhodosporidiobolus poonsookiae]